MKITLKDNGKYDIDFEGMSVIVDIPCNQFADVKEIFNCYKVDEVRNVCFFYNNGDEVVISIKVKSCQYCGTKNDSHHSATCPEVVKKERDKLKEKVEELNLQLIHREQIKPHEINKDEMWETYNNE